MSLKKYLTEAELKSVQPVTGDEFGISINDVTNIETTVVEHVDGAVLIELDDKAISMLEGCGLTLEDEEQLDEIWPALAAAGGAVARGVGGAVARTAGAAGDAIVKSAATSVLKAAGNKVDKAIFGRGVTDDTEESVSEATEIAVGDIVMINYATLHKGHMGEVVELAPSGKFAYVQFKDDDIESYDLSSLRKVTPDEEEEYRYGEDFDESLNDIRRLSGLKEAEVWDKTHLGPYDRGSADSYYGRKFDPHKFVDDIESGVKGARKRVALTDPKEIAAYRAGYEENDDQKDYGSFPDYGDMDEGIENWKMGVTSIPRTEPFKLKKIVVTSKHGKTYTFDTEQEAKQHFGSNWAKISDEAWRNANGWKLDMNNAKPELGEAEYKGREVSLGKPTSGDVKKYKVFVKDPSTGNVKKVNFGDKNMEIKRDNPERKKSFRARHNCSSKKDRTTAGYWSCKMWSNKPVSKIVK